MITYGQDYPDPFAPDGTPEPERRIVQPPGAPLPNARQFVTENYAHPDHLRLVSHGETFWTWNGPCWFEVEDAALRKDLYSFFGDAMYWKPTKKAPILEPFDPTAHKVHDLLDALRAITHLPRSVVPPAWIGEATGPADQIVSCANGILDVETRTLQPHTPNLYVQHAVPFAFDPDAPDPARWLQFLDELWPGDAEAIAALQEAFGYVLSGDTSLQKMFLIVGPKRSGKGTIARVLKAMIGGHHVAGPTLASLASNFGLEPLIGKSLAIVADARITDGHSIVIERLLSISGEDMLTIDRKYRPAWSGTLPTRIVIMTNELPKLSDSSGALASRFVMLVTRTSFYGREDPSLTSTLLGELPGILNWSLEGLDRLRAAGRLTEPASSQDAVRELDELSSPVGAFVRDRCVTGAGQQVACDVLYQAWRASCEEHGRDRPGTAQTFGRDLRAAVIGLRVIRPWDVTGVRPRLYEGITLAPPEIHTDQTANYRGLPSAVRNSPRPETNVSTSVYTPNEDPDWIDQIADYLDGST